MLTATQLQESAVYLSLKYIAILLQSNTSIEGAEGSEYRLFIVALMLGKTSQAEPLLFIDDPVVLTCLNFLSHSSQQILG